MLRITVYLSQILIVVAWELCKKIYMKNIYDDIKIYMFKWLSLRDTKSDCDFKGKIILTADWLAK